MHDKTLRAGLIGYGFAGKVFHAPLIRTTPGMAIAAVSSSDAAKVHADLGDAVTVLDDAPALIASDDIDLVVVASPNNTHFELARLALEAGKHVVVDKPFTPTLDEALQLARLAHGHGLVLSVFHNRRWDSSTRSAERLLLDGTLGRLRHAALHFDRFRPNPQARWKEDAAAGGGVWMDLGPHLLYDALHLFGRPLAIQADLPTLRSGSGSNSGALAADNVQARLRYADGLRVDVCASMLAAAPGPRLALHGTRGSYVKPSLDPQEADLKAGKLPGADPAAWGVDAEPGILRVERDGVLHESTLATENGAYPEYYRLLRAAILGQAANPVPPRDAIDVMRLLEAGRRSHAERREILLEEVPGLA